LGGLTRARKYAKNLLSHDVRRSGLADAARQSAAEEAAKNNPVPRYMLECKIPICQKHYIELCYMGDRRSLEELDGEEIVLLPDGFESWPVNELKACTFSGY
jgi:hypothetical protein